MNYTQQELIDLLDAEVKRSVQTAVACSPTKNYRPDDPDWAAIWDLNVENSLKATEAYWDLRSQVQEYQKANNITGVVWNEATYKGKTISSPCIHTQLLGVSGDKEVLIAAAPSIITWWAEVTEGMNLCKCSVDDTNDDEPVTLEQILLMVPQAEWAEVRVSSNPYPEITLALCWGDADAFADCEQFSGWLNPPTADELERQLELEGGDRNG